jgi:hypothetical protein
MQPTDSAILYADLPTAQARSAQMATAMGCDGVFTKYWWQCLSLTNGQGALIVRASGPFGTRPGPVALQQLTAGEIASLQTYATVQPLLPVAVTSI